MKLKIAFALILLPTFIFAQVVEKKKKHDDTFQQLIKILGNNNLLLEDIDDFCAIQNKRNDIYFQKTDIFERKLENGISQKASEISLKDKSLCLNILLKDSLIIYLNLYSEDAQLFERKTPMTEQYSNWKKFPSRLYEYGTFCGIAGVPTTMCMKMIELVKVKNYDELSEWLYSSNPEIVAYGFMGLDFLRRRGFVTKESDMGRINQVKEDETQLYVCEGCLINVSRKLKDVVAESILNENYLALTKYRWLK